MQERLRRNASAIDAHAARVRLRVDQRGLQSEIGGEKCRGVSAGAAADDDELSRDHEWAGGAGAAGGAGGAGRASRTGKWRAWNRLDVTTLMASLSPALSP